MHVLVNEKRVGEVHSNQVLVQSVRLVPGVGEHDNVLAERRPRQVAHDLLELVDLLVLTQAIVDHMVGLAEEGGLQLVGENDGRIVQVSVYEPLELGGPGPRKDDELSNVHSIVDADHVEVGVHEGAYLIAVAVHEQARLVKDQIPQPLEVGAIRTEHSNERKRRGCDQYLATVHQRYGVVVFVATALEYDGFELFANRTHRFDHVGDERVDALGVRARRADD